METARLKCVNTSGHWHKDGHIQEFGTVEELPVKFLDVFPNVFEVDNGVKEKKVEEPKVELEPAPDIENIDLLGGHAVSLTELAGMNGEALKKIAPEYGVDPERYETVKALRKAIRAKIEG